MLAQQMEKTSGKLVVCYCILLAMRPERRLKNRKLEKRIKELTESRDSWKNKAKFFREENRALEKENNSLEEVLKKN